MKQLERADPCAHLGCHTVFSSAESEQKLKMAERFGIQIIGFYRAELGASWSSGGRLERDCLHHIELVCSGRRQVVHEGEVMELAPGQAWFLPGCTPVERRCNEYCRIYFVKFRCEWLLGVDPLLDWPERRPLCLGPWEPGFYQDLERLGTAPDLKHLLLLRAQIHRWLAEALPDLERIINDHIRSHSRFERVFELMQARLGADLRVCDLAAVMNLPVSAFSMAFNRNVGMSPKAWLSRCLNQEAIRLLIQSDVPTKNVAQQLRFSDEYHFSRFFKRLNGLAPTPYRQQFFDRRAS